MGETPCLHTFGDLCVQWLWGTLCAVGGATGGSHRGARADENSEECPPHYSATARAMNSARERVGLCCSS
eukprot:scaffold67284_cov66-Phaeocystis_antarctica.AAC.5